MAPQRRVRSPGLRGARTPKKTLGRTYTMEDKDDPKHKPIDVFDFSDMSDISSIGRLGENEEPFEIFDPPLHSTAIDADEVISGLSIHSTPQGKDAKRSLDTSEIESSDSESVTISAKKQRKKPKPTINDKSETDKESDVRRKVNTDKITTQDEATPATASSELPEDPAKSVTPQKRVPHSAEPSTGKETLTRESQPNIQKKEKLFHGKKKKSKNKNSGTSDYVHIWCLKKKKTSDITELDVVLSTFEKICLEYKQEVKSEVCKEAISKFHSNIKEELIKMLKEVQMVKTLQRKNTKVISDINKKRQRLIEVQDEVLWLEPQLKQLQVKYEELKERKSALRNAAYFLSNLRQLHQDYSNVQEKKPKVKEMYDSSSLPALLFQARTLLGAENHLQNINQQLEKLLAQD
ncbi:centromere protein U isoform X1 [Erinaceus europaeus]|uniref:Centromere protein U n=2 Tax=Erinaceus europaeus TaxID=9365 RepID=A0ABM3WU35_ERIEU|nr:centromere protein U isoform X1 [Erinaceus europaeus]